MAAVLSTVTGCVASEKRLGGFPVYADAKPKSSVSYAISAPIDHRTKKILDLGLTLWNEAIGSKVLYWTTGEADVEVDFSVDEKLRDQPGFVELDGCLEGVRVAWFGCVVRLMIPKKIESQTDLIKVAHLFRQGPLDDRLLKIHNQTDVMVYLREKLLLLAFVHEVGHTIGLAHSDDPSCLMAAVPRGGLGFCQAEVEAARRLLSIE
jgi:hypothetical protein